jgi:GT2 family glycosyltransferase
MERPRVRIHMGNLDLSVVIATRNRPEELIAALESLREQRVQAARYEIVIVDDGSAEPVTLPESLGEPKCTVSRLTGLGRSAARNAGALLAKGGILVFIDDDITVKSDFLQAHLVSHQEWPDLLAVGAIQLPESVRLSPFGRFRQSLENDGVPRSRGLTLMRNFCAAGNMSISRERFQLIGGFDETIESGEDQDLAFRHTSRGGRIVFLPEAEAIHHDTALDIRSYCARSEWGMERILPFCSRYPEWPENVVRARVNGQTRIGLEPLGQTLRKVTKLALTTRPALASMFAIASLLERLAPESLALDKCYRLLLGAHIFRGYRRGLKQPLPIGQASLGDKRSTA